MPVPPTPSFSELQEWQDISKAREDKIRELESSNESLRHELRVLTVVRRSRVLEAFKLTLCK